MSVIPSESLHAADEPASPLRDPAPFSLRAEQVRQVAREAAGSDVQRILQLGQERLRAQRERHALELLAAESQAQQRTPPWRLACGLAALSALAVGAFALLDQAQLSEAPAWSFSPPAMQVEAAIAYSDAYAEREVAEEATVKRLKPGRRPKRTRTHCDPNSFDPIDACL